MKKIRSFLTILFLGSLAASLTTCAGTAKLNGIVVNPPNPQVTVGATQKFTATGFFNDQTTRDITSEVTWSSSIPSVATINSNGLATAISPGVVTITATSTIPNSFSSATSSGTTAFGVISASLSSISVTPANSRIPMGIARQFSAAGAYLDGTSFDITTQVIWSSSNTSFATVDRNGLATAIAPGTVTITATSGTITGSTTLTVDQAGLSSISVTTANPSVPVGFTPQFTASGAFSNGAGFDISTQVIWSSSNTSIATVDSNGLATAVAAGTVTITATSGTISGSKTLTVTSAALSSISVTPVNPSMPVGLATQFAASGTYSDGTRFDITTQVVWSSSVTSVAVVDSNGSATSIAPGITTITAASGTILGSTTLTVTPATLSSISVTPANLSIPGGVTQQFAASGLYSDGTAHDITTLVIWTSSNTSVATVSSNGLATTAVAGTATITAASGTITGSTALTVTSATLASISVTPANPSIPVGATQQFTASGIYSDGTSHDITRQVVWTSSSPPVATVNGSGLATAVATGSATISAASGAFGNTTLTVQ